MQNLMQIHCSTPSVILNVSATQYMCSLKGIYCPHWLLQWSCHCSCMHIPVHSSLLPGYSDVVQTILLILTMAGLFFPDRPHISACISNDKTIVYNINHSNLLVILEKHHSSEVVPCWASQNVVLLFLWGMRYLYSILNQFTYVESHSFCQ